MLADVVDRLRCPHCAAALALDGPVLRCTEGHAYDVARHGYVTLLPPRGARHPGDTAEMVAAREAFLAGGHYLPIAEAVAEAARSAAMAARSAASARAGELPGDEGVAAAGGRVAGDEGVAVAGGEIARDGLEAGRGCVVDVGAGTGWYLGRVLDGLPGWVGVALDASRHALRRAARVPRVGAVVANAWRSLPVRDGAADLVLSVFAPRDADEIARILAPGGALIVVTPTPRHLAELVAELGMLRVDVEKPERLAAKLSRFRQIARRELEFALDLPPDDVRALVAMGPSAHHLDVAALGVEPATVTASVTVQALRAAA